MDFQSQAVTEAVTEILSQSMLVQFLPGCSIHGLARCAGLYQRKGKFLGRQHGLIDFLLPLIGLADTDGTRHVGAVSFIHCTKIQRHKLSLSDCLIRGNTMGQRTAQPGCNDGLEGWLLRPQLAHLPFHASRHSQLSDARTDEAQNVLKGGIGNPAGPADQLDFRAVLDFPQNIQLQRRLEFYTRHQFRELCEVVVNKGIAFKAHLLATYFFHNICSLLQQAVLLLDQLIEWCLHLRLLRIATVSHQHCTFGRNDKGCIIAAKATEIMQVHVFGDNYGIQPFLHQQSTQSCQALFNHSQSP